MSTNQELIDENRPESHPNWPDFIRCLGANAVWSERTFSDRYIYDLWEVFVAGMDAGRSLVSLHKLSKHSPGLTDKLFGIPKD